MNQALKKVIININRNTIAAFANIGLNLIIALIFPVWIIKALGSSQYGQWILLQSWTSIIQAPLIGINSSILSFLSNSTYCSRSFLALFKSYAIYSFASIFVLSLTGYLTCVFSSSTQIHKWSLIILFVSYFFKTVSEILILLPKVYQRYDLYYLQQSLFQVFFLFFSLSFITSTAEIDSLVLSFALAATVQFLICLMFFGKALLDLDTSVISFIFHSEYSFIFLKKIFGLGKLDILFLLNELFGNFAIRQVLPTLGSLQELTYLDLSSRLTAQTYKIPSLIFSNLIPSITYLHFHAKELLPQFIENTHRYLSIVTIFMLSFLLVNAHFFSLILLSKYSFSFVFILVTIILSSGLDLTTGVYTNSLVAMKKIDLISNKILWELEGAIIINLCAISMREMFTPLSYILLINLSSVLSVFIFYAKLNLRSFLKIPKFKLYPWFKLLYYSVFLFLVTSYVSQCITIRILNYFQMSHSFLSLLFNFFIYLIMSSPLVFLLKLIDLTEISAFLRDLKISQ